MDRAVPQVLLVLLGLAGPMGLWHIVTGTNDDLEHLIQNNETLQFTLDSFPDNISIHYLGHKLFKSAFKLIPKFMTSKTPLSALTIFTDGSGSSHKSVMTWKDP